MLTIDPIYVSFITGPILVPLIVALLARAHISVKVKTGIVAAVSAVVAAIASFVIPETGAAVLSWEAVGSYLIVFLTAKGGYDQFWKPILSLNEHVFPNKGIGTALPQESIAAVPVEQGVIAKGRGAAKPKAQGATGARARKT